MIKSNNPHLAGGEKTTSFIHDHGISQVEVLILKHFQPDPAPFGDDLGRLCLPLLSAQSTNMLVHLAAASARE